MKITDYISYTIDRFPRGYVFTSSDFPAEVNQKEAIIKALNRMVAAGKIAKLSKGKYYKPENTPFGTLQPTGHRWSKICWKRMGKRLATSPVTAYTTAWD